MNEGNNNNVQAALDAGCVMTGILNPAAPVSGSKPFIALPEGYQAHDLESMLAIPTRHRGAVTMLDADSFIAYAKDQGSLASCKLYANVDYEQSRCEIVAVLNDHTADTPAWRDHTATFAPKLGVEYKRWTGSNGIKMPQSKFATFLEENMGDVRSIDGSPDGTQMLAMALDFEATSEKRFKKVIDLQTNGVQLEYVDKADETTSRKFQLFKRFTIAVPVFQGSNSAYPIECRLKFIQQNDSLSFWYELIRIDRVFKQAVTEELATIKEKTGFMLLYGTPGL